MLLGKAQRDRVGDWLIILAVAVAALIMVGTLVLTVVLQLGNHELLTTNHELTQANAQLLRHSERNHAIDEQIQAELRSICTATGARCPLP